MRVRIPILRVLRGLHIVGIKSGNNYSTNNGMLVIKNTSTKSLQILTFNYKIYNTL